MKNNLLELNGIDNINDYNFKWKVPGKIEGSIDFNDKKILGSSISKKIISTKIINSFENINLDKFEVFQNIFICNVMFNISIEYCDNLSFGKINLLNKSIYKTFFGSLKDYDFCNIDSEVLIIDFDLIKNEDNLHYFIDIIIGINEM